MYWPAVKSQTSSKRRGGHLRHLGICGTTTLVPAGTVHVALGPLRRVPASERAKRLRIPTGKRKQGEGAPPLCPRPRTCQRYLRGKGACRRRSHRAGSWGLRCSTPVKPLGPHASRACAGVGMVWFQASQSVEQVRTGEQLMKMATGKGARPGHLSEQCLI